MFFFLVSFLAGVLTVLAPCVLSLIPVIVGWSLATEDRSRPYVITASLAVSVVLFTLLIKVSTLFINVPPSAFTYISGSIVLFMGIITLFPALWQKIALATGFEHSSQQALESNTARTGFLGAVLTGVALGPVFSSCSPTYSLILATVLPQSFALGVAHLSLYSVGLSVTLLAIGLIGQRLIKRLRWAANPNGLFRRILGILFILVGLAVVTGYDKTVEAGILRSGYFDVTKVEQRLLTNSEMPKAPTAATSVPTASQSVEFNVDKPYPAPEVSGIESWINSKPLKIADLKGKVVIVDFWTYSCINCQRTLPYLVEWDKKYRDKGLVIIGVHAPEFAFEKKLENVQGAVKSAGIAYPVALDNDYATWRAYDNQYWPAKYFIDRQGKVRHTHFGEGSYEESEKIIQALLSEGGPTVSEETVKDPDHATAFRQTPETYVGTLRQNAFAGNEDYANGASRFAFPSSVPSNGFALSGKWTIEDEGVTSASGSALRLNFGAKDVYLVMSAKVPAKAQVLLDGKPIGELGGKDVHDSVIDVSEDRLYHLASLPAFAKEKLLEIRFDGPIMAHAFTFGS